MSYLDKLVPNQPIPVMRFKGKSKCVLDFINTLATTWPVETDKDWWSVKLRMLNIRN